MKANDLTVMRVQQIIEAVERAPLEGFDMSVWWNNSTTGRPRGCAIGWALQQPGVTAQGLCLRPCLAGYQVVYGRRSGYSAIARFLGIPKHDAIRLFQPGNRHVRQKNEVLIDLNTYLEHRKVENLAGPYRWLTRQALARARCTMAHRLSMAIQLAICLR